MADFGSPSFAFFAQGDAYSTAGKIMGRQAAGVGFLRGIARTWPTGQLHALTAGRFDRDGLEQTLRSDGFTGEIRWSTPPEFTGARAAGAMYFPSPPNSSLARFRNRIAPAAYSLFGVTHTLSTDRTMDGIAQFLMPPFKPWDALVCTSRAALTVVNDLWDEVREQLREEAGVERFVRVQTPVIPLGVHCDAYDRSEAARAAARARLGLADDEVAVLFAGRLSFHAKANPVVLYQGLQAVSGQAKLVCIEAGLHPNESTEQSFIRAQQTLAPNVRFIHARGDDRDAYEAAWRAADIFTSLSDNVQETFGLTPVEAMAAGLPVIVSDWNGYRDNVRHGIDGFLIPTFAPPAGCGEDLALAVESEVLTYDRQIGIASLAVAVDLKAVIEAIHTLVHNPELRRSMGASGRERALSTFDWPIIMRQYDVLCSQLAIIRAAGESQAAQPWPQRADIFRRFAGFASHAIASDDMVSLNPGAGVLLKTLSELEVSSYGFHPRLAPRELPMQLARILHSKGGPTSVRSLLAMAGGDIPVNQRALAWLVKFGVIKVERA